MILQEKNLLQKMILLKIENKMKEIVDRDEITKREVWEREQSN